MSEEPFDTVIEGAVIVEPGEVPRPATLAVRNGKIAAIAAPGTRLEARETVDGTGRHLFPGIIEPHTHWSLGDGLEDFYTESRSAALGGVTTNFLFLRGPEPYDEMYEEYTAYGNANSLIDFSYHAVLMIERHLEELDHYVEDLGITSFKFYLTYRGEDARIMGIEGVDDGYLRDACHAVARHPRALLIAHCENIEVVQREQEKLKEAGRDDMAAWQASRPVIAEVDGVRRAMLFAEEARCRLNVLHLTSKAALDEIVHFRSRYPDIYAEVCHTYLTYNGDGEVPKVAKVKPALRTVDDNEALWRAIAEGAVQTVGSDHVPRKKSVKLGSVWDPYTGTPGTAMLFPILLSEGYHKRSIPLGRIAEVTSLSPARLYSLYPHKGHLGIGADADLTLVDLEEVRTVQAEDLQSFADYTLYEGWDVTGWPTDTMVRGQWVMRDGEVVGLRGTGQYVPR